MFAKNCRAQLFKGIKDPFNKMKLIIQELSFKELCFQKGQIERKI